MSPWVDKLKLVNKRNCPSGDQSSGTLFSFEEKSRVSESEPLEALLYRSASPARSELNAILVPSGDQTGFCSRAPSKVRRVLEPRTRSIIQMSSFCVRKRDTA